MRDGLREGFRYANIVIAIIAPIFLVAAILLRHAGPVVLQSLVWVCFVSGAVVLHVLMGRADRRRGRGQ